MKLLSPACARAGFGQRRVIGRLFLCLSASAMRKMLDRDQNRGFLAGWTVSVLLHIGLVGVLADWNALASTNIHPADLPSEEERIRLGIEESQASTITWLGFEEPTPHEAPEGVIDQAEFAIGDTPQGGAEVGPTVSPTNDGAIREAVQQRLASLMDSILRTTESVENALGVAQAETAVATSDDGAEAVEESPRPESQTGGGGAASGQTPAAGVGDGEPGDGEPEAEAGNSDRESPATAVKKPTRVEPGQPAAAEGLEIKTVRPQWTHYTRLTARPGNPIVVVHFDAAGKVARASFKRSTGTKDVDGPLLDAVYRWHATGEALAELGGEGEEETIELEFEIVLRR